jgi:hypothetical protein
LPHLVTRQRQADASRGCLCLPHKDLVTLDAERCCGYLDKQGGIADASGDLQSILQVDVRFWPTAKRGQCLPMRPESEGLVLDTTDIAAELERVLREKQGFLPFASHVSQLSACLRQPEPPEPPMAPLGMLDPLGNLTDDLLGAHGVPTPYVVEQEIESGAHLGEHEVGRACIAASLLRQPLVPGVVEDVEVEAGRIRHRARS